MIDYGTDLSCVTDLDPSLAEVSGRTCTLQAIVRRLSTPRGTLAYDPNYGYDLAQFVNADVGPNDVGRMQSQAAGECLKDERILNAVCTTQLHVDGVLIVSIALTDALGPFKLVLSTSAVTVQILATT